MPTRALQFTLALACALLASCTFDNSPSYGGTGGGYGGDPYEVGYTAPSYNRSSWGSFGTGYGYGGGYRGGHAHHRKYDDHDYDDHDKHHSKKSSSSSSHKKSSSNHSSSKKSSSKKSSSKKSSSSSSRAKEWQKDKGGNPRAKRGS
jgi:hypothetical protein